MTRNFIFSTAWGNQPYSLGSYTSIAVGGQPHDIEKIADPLYLKPNKRSVSSVLDENQHLNPAFVLYPVSRIQ